MRSTYWTMVKAAVNMMCGEFKRKDLYITFTSLHNKDVNGGTLATHLNRLELAGFVKRVRTGVYERVRRIGDEVTVNDCYNSITSGHSKDTSKPADAMYQRSGWAKTIEAINLNDTFTYNSLLKQIVLKKNKPITKVALSNYLSHVIKGGFIERTKMEHYKVVKVIPSSITISECRNPEIMIAALSDSTKQPETIFELLQRIEVHASLIPNNTNAFAIQRDIAAIKSKIL